MPKMVDAAVVKLSVAYNTCVDKEIVEKLPEDLRGDAIPSLILGYESAKAGYLEAKSGESGAVGSSAEVYEVTERMLVRARYAVLAAYEDDDDPRIAGYGALGLGKNQSDNQKRLANLSQTTKAPFESGELPLAKDLTPEKMAAQAKAHGDLTVDKGGSVTERQTNRQALTAKERELRATLRRLRNFVQAFLGDAAMTEFGFDLPAPAVRPRLKKVARDPGPPAA